MKFEFGAPKALDDISLQDAMNHPIWLWAWEAGLEGEVEDETWQCPVLNTSDVTDAMTEPVVTLRIEGNDVIGSASYNAELDQLEAISIWENGAWTGIQETTLATPITLIAVPSIRGVTGVRFVCSEPDEDRASRES